MKEPEAGVVLVARRWPPGLRWYRWRIRPRAGAGPGHAGALHVCVHSSTPSDRARRAFSLGWAADPGRFQGYNELEVPARGAPNPDRYETKLVQGYIVYGSCSLNTFVNGFVNAFEMVS